MPSSEVPGALAEKPSPDAPGTAEHEAAQTSRGLELESLRLQRDLALLLSQATELHPALEGCLRCAMSATDLEAGAIYLSDGSGAFELGIMLGTGPAFTEAMRHFDSDTAYARLSQPGRPRIAHYLDLGLPDHPAWREEGFRVLAVTPFSHEGQVLGSLCLSSRRLDTLPSETALLIETMAAQMGGAIARLRSENALKKVELRHHRVLANLKDVVSTFDAAGRMTWCSPAVTELGGYDAEAEVGSHFSKYCVGPEDIAIAGRALESLLRTERPQTFQLRYKPAWGGSMPVEFTVNCVREENGEILLHTVMRDISERRRTEDALRASDALHRATIDALDEVVFVLDDHLRLTLFNSAFLAFVRCTPENGRKPPNMGDDYLTSFPFVPSEEWEEYREVLESGRTHQTRRSYTIDGCESQVEVRKIPVIEDGLVTRVLTVIRDLTTTLQAQREHERLQENLRQVQRLESIGRLAGGIAHDFNNLLTPILGYTELAQEKAEGNDSLSNDLQRISSAAARARDLTQQLLALGRKQVLRMQILDLNQVCGEFEPMLRRIIGGDIVIETIYEPDLWPVKADPSLLQQVIMNLVLNARDAMPQGGPITIETARVLVDQDWARLHPGASAGPHVLLSVADRGSGMSEVTLSRAFDPFYTTKEKGKGTGLGLAMVMGLVQQHGGFIHVESALGRGTIFRIYLPRESEQPTAEPAEQEANDQLVPLQATVLVVEDEDAVRAFVAKVLERRGFLVLQAADATEAVRVATQYKGSIHLALLDVILAPRSGVQPLRSPIAPNGRAVFDAIAPEHPETRALFMSGYPDDIIGQHGILEARVNFLQKPFSMNALLTRVREVLEQDPVALTATP